MSFSERCERLAVKAGQEAYDRARAAGLGHREAHCVAREAEDARRCELRNAFPGVKHECRAR
jgi:hypothetical protein